MCEQKLSELASSVSLRMSEKRFKHTLGVEILAAEIGKLVMPQCVFELRCAALLHDVAKELPSDQISKLLSKSDRLLTTDDMKTPSVFHAFAAPQVIKRDFAEYATPNVLSATFNHTTGDPDMSLFDQIIFISDFAEAGREYPSCKKIAKLLRARCNPALSVDECIKGINQTTYDTLCEVISTLERLGTEINSRTLLTKKAFAVKI